MDGEGVTARYQWIDQHLGAWITRGPVPRSWTDRLDAVLLHPVAGFALFLGIMVVVFQALFAWSEPLIGLVEGGIGWVGTAVRSLVPAGILADFLAEAVVGGVGNVLVFVPQIALLFIFISLMEDTGYMSRIAFLMDRIMNRVGLHGRAFVPMLSAYACAVPAVMATRTMERRRDRYLTMMVLPLTTCSARLPVYTLLIAALVPATIVGGIISAQSLVMVGLYLFGTVTALVAAAVIGRTVLKGERVPLLMELPPYRRPSTRSVGRRVVRRSWLFVRDAGAFILICTAILWVLLYFPRENEEVRALQQQHAAVSAPTAEQAAAFALEIEGAQKRGSFAGRIGRFIEPALEPFGQDWQVGVGLLGAFAAREVFVSTMGLIFGMGHDVDADSAPLRARLRSEKKADGEPRYTPLSALALMIFLALACQCMSTLA
ncbi:MAG: ferrous iron transporter B, partial [bacterium]